MFTFLRNCQTVFTVAVCEMNFEVKWVEVSSLRFWFACPWWLMMLCVSSCVCWVSVYLFWRNVYSNLFCISYLGYLSFYYLVVRIVFFFFPAPWGLWGLISLTRDWTWASAMKAPNHWTTREFPRVLYIFWIIPCQVHDLQTFSLSSFSFFDGIIYSTKVCNFHEVQFTYFSFVSSALSIIIKEPLPNPRSLGFISVFSFLLFYLCDRLYFK